MIFQYETTQDEDAAMIIGLAMTNGSLMSQGKEQVDMRGYFTLWVREKMTPLVQQALHNRAQPLLTAFLKADEATRTQMLTAATKDAVKP